MSAIPSNLTAEKVSHHLKLVSLPAGLNVPEFKAHQNLQNLDDNTLSALIDALATAEPSLKNQIEDILVDLAPIITQTLVHGLNHENIHARSTCAMVLIRTGRIHRPAVERFMAQPSIQEDARWTADFVLEHMA